MVYTNRKEFKDATIESFAYGRILLILAVVSISFLYIIFDYSKLLKFKEYDDFTISFLAITLSVVFLLIVSFVYLRNHWIFKVITDVRGLTFKHFLKEDFVRWDQVTSIAVGNNFFIGNRTKGQVGEVKTKDRNYCFPFTMKEKGQIYPAFCGTIGKFYWKDEHGNRLQINADNCALYNEIKKYLNERQYSGNT